MSDEAVPLNARLEFGYVFAGRKWEMVISVCESCGEVRGAWQCASVGSIICIRRVWGGVINCAYFYPG